MSSFTEKQKKIIDYLLESKGKGEMNDLICLRLLFKSENITAIEWDNREQEYLKIYAPTDNELENKYFAVIDFLYLINRLCAEKYIVVQDISNVGQDRINRNEPKFYFDSRFKQREKTNDKGEVIKYWAKVENGKEVEVKHKVSETYTQMTWLIDKYEYAVICPLHALDELKARNYMTVDQYRFQQQMLKQNKQIKNALLAIIIPSVISFLTFFISLWSSCENSNDLHSIKEAIQQTKVEFPKQIAVSHTDTLQVNEINSENNSIKGVGWELSELNKTLKTNTKSNSNPNI